MTSKKIREKHEKKPIINKLISAPNHNQITMVGMFLYKFTSLFENALSLSAHEHINIQTIIIQKFRIASNVTPSFRQMSNLGEVQNYCYHFVALSISTLSKKKYRYTCINTNPNNMSMHSIVAMKNR